MIVFQSAHCAACVHPLKKMGAGTALGEVLGLQLISNSHLKISWQMTQDLTDN